MNRSLAAGQAATDKLSSPRFDSLSLQDRSILVSCLRNGRSVGWLARAFGLSQTTVRRILKRAIAALQ